MNSAPWVGQDVCGGVPSHDRRDRVVPPHWRLDAIFATSRPYHLRSSPDGRNLAFLYESNGTTDVWTVASDGVGPVRLTTDRGLAAFWEDNPPVWSPDGSRIAYTSEGWAFLVPVQGGPPRKLVEATPVAWLDDRRMIVTLERDECTRLATIDVDDPWPAPFGPTTGDVGEVGVGSAGTVFATFWPKDERNRSDIIRADTDGGWDVFVSEPDRRASGATVGQARVAYLLETDDWTAVYIASIDGADHSCVAQDTADFSNLVWEEGELTLVGVRTARGQSDLVRIDVEAGTVTLMAEGGSWQTPQLTGSNVAAIYESAVVAPCIVRLGASGDQTTLVDGAPGPVRAIPHVAFERVAYPSLDGLEIEGFLARPPTPVGAVPVVVYPHGGPTSAYGDEWDGHAQYFLDKGYAWFAINFRGSTTYGVGFERANHHDWGVGDVDDCIAAARFLGGLDGIDPSRIAIFGASYGSYLALASLVRDDNPFACGVAKYGDSNILTSWAQSDRGGSDDLERMMGRPSDDREGYRRGSPIHRIDHLHAPLLIAHGELDARVHPKQSQELVDELERLNKTYEYVTYPTEGHGLLRREPQIHFYTRLERFLDWYLM